ncbi:methyltransferase family protein [Hoeflea marina]|uniref:Methyltransferase family protein n=2 Tax=Hoeflea marina TaxID=274592 RepID=A0A317PK96_9HYPH|nr:methyltransferase family protein [Hoeflea marina]
MDLNRERLPFEDNSIGVVFSYHTLEHLDNYLFALSEIHRVLKHGGVFLVGVPYLTLTQYNLVNPYHRQNFNEYSFDFFDPQKLLGSAAEAGSVMFRKAFHRFHYLPEFEGRSDKRKDWCRRHLLNVVQKIDFGLIAMKSGGAPVVSDDATAESLLLQFDGYLKARRAYPTQPPGA